MKIKIMNKSQSILGIGNAIVDVFAHVNENFLKKNNLIKGSMRLVTFDELNKIKNQVKIKKIQAGGSVANSMAGISYLNGKCSFIGKVNKDNFGSIYKKSLKKINVDFLHNAKKEKLATGTSLILITPDSERTMCTYLGISSQLNSDDIKEKHIKNRALVFLEGYLWDKGTAKKMFEKTIKIAKKNKVEVAMSLSDFFCVERHKKDFVKLLKNDLNLLFGNEKEILELTNTKNLEKAMSKLKKINKLIIITREKKGSLVIRGNYKTICKANKVEKILDMTGAGDLFASGFLYEYLNNNNLENCLKKGSLLASKIIQKIGARIH
jgi:sugar/nucleoside kinase (ribokinase family)